MRWITQQINRIPQPWRLIAFCVGIVIILLLVWFYGTRAANGLSSWWYSRGTRAAHEEIDRLTTEAIKAKGIAAEALAALEKEKEITKAEREKRELAEELLTDKSKTANEKLRIYEDALKKAPVISGPSFDTDELCRRATALGISCSP